MPSLSRQRERRPCGGSRRGGRSFREAGRAAGGELDFCDARPLEAGGLTEIQAILISSTDETICAALERLDPAACRVDSSNGDRLDFSGARRLVEKRGPAPGVSELALAFASPFALTMPKAGREETKFCEDLREIDLSAALRANLSARAGREMDIAAAVDPLSLAVDGRRRLITLRRQKGRRIFIPAFSLPITLRGAPEDLRFAYYAGLGAKTRAGFGCPILTH